MNVLVDTSAWSFAYRRPALQQNQIAHDLSELIREGRATIIGVIRQELLSGIRDATTFELLRDKMRAFPDTTLETQDYETAAEFSNICRAKGIQSSVTDMLICAVASRRNQAILTTDKDFDRYANILPVRLFATGTLKD